MSILLYKEMSILFIGLGCNIELMSGYRWIHFYWSISILLMYVVDATNWSWYNIYIVHTLNSFIQLLMCVKCVFWWNTKFNFNLLIWNVSSSTLFSRALCLLCRKSNTMLISNLPTYVSWNLVVPIHRTVHAVLENMPNLPLRNFNFVIYLHIKYSLSCQLIFGVKQDVCSKSLLFFLLVIRGYLSEKR